MKISAYGNFERRKNPRNLYSGSIFFAANKKLYEAELKNFSQNGLFIKTHETFYLGETITVALPYLKAENDKRKGQIIRSSPEGFGIKLLNQHNGKKIKVRYR